MNFLKGSHKNFARESSRNFPEITQRFSSENPNVIPSANLQDMFLGITHGVFQGLFKEISLGFQSWILLGFLNKFPKRILKKKNPLELIKDFHQRFLREFNSENFFQLFPPRLHHKFPQEFFKKILGDPQGNI